MERQAPKEATGELVDKIQGLPLDAQLGLIRTVLPQLLQGLQGEQRLGFMRDLLREMEHSMSGGAPYDLRPDAPSHEPL